MALDAEILMQILGLKALMKEVRSTIDTASSLGVDWQRVPAIRNALRSLETSPGGPYPPAAPPLPVPPPAAIPGMNPQGQRVPLGAITPSGEGPGNVVNILRALAQMREFAQ